MSRYTITISIVYYIIKQLLSRHFDRPSHRFIDTRLVRIFHHKVLSTLPSHLTFRNWLVDACHFRVFHHKVLSTLHSHLTFWKEGTVSPSFPHLTTKKTRTLFTSRTPFTTPSAKTAAKIRIHHAFYETLFHQFTFIDRHLLKYTSK
jgi:hypothetical protein